MAVTVKMGRVKKLRALAVLMVMILLASSIVVIVSNSEGYYPDDGTGGTITYNLGNGVFKVDEDGDKTTSRSNIAYTVKPDGTVTSESSDTVSVTLQTYFGIKSTEYNPEFWSGWGEVPIYDGTRGMNDWIGPEYTATWEGIEITVSRGAATGDVPFTLPTGCTLASGSLTIPDGQDSVSITINYTATLNKVFGGWEIPGYPETTIYPGEVVAWSVETLNAKWIEPDLYANKNVTVANGTIPMPVQPYVVLQPGTSNIFEVDLTGYSCNNPEKTMFSSIYYLDGTKSYSLQSSKPIPTGTYRTENPYGIYGESTRTDKIDYKAQIYISSYGILSGDVVIDNITFNCNSSNTHGGSTASAILAYGHRLILGTNISTTDYERQNGVGESDRISKAPVIIGGKPNNQNVTERICNQTVYLNDAKKSTFKVDIGTFVIVHSGVYNSIVAGGLGNIGSNGTPLSTYAVLKDCLVIDTVGAGGGSDAGGNVFGHMSEHSGKIDGGSFLYAIGLFMLGDQWQDSESGYKETVTGKYADDTPDSYKNNGNTREYIKNKQSSVAQGGSHKGHVYGSSHLIISGRSSMWDCMGGGRDAQSQTDYAYMEITGKAEVRRVACGTITDGEYQYKSYDCVGTAHVYISEDTIVASVYGAGFDTWAYPEYNSMRDGTILVEISGGKIGDVFGGGYRGSVGTPDDLSKLTIRVHITGEDTVIEGNVYGGGSGGLNKIKHASNGKGFQNSSQGIDGNQKSTGRSYVYGNIDVTIDGGTINGNVYGGGMSVPKLSSYTNVYSNENLTTPTTVFLEETDITGKGAKICETATVVGNVTLTVGGNAKINGDVFGAGQGLILNPDGTVDESQYGFNKVIYKDGNKKTIERQYWVIGGDNTNNREYDNSSSLSYANYAQIKGNVTVIIENESWYQGRSPIIGDTYTVNAQNSDEQGFIVLHRGSTLPTGYNVVKISDDIISIKQYAEGAPIENVIGWKVKGEVIEGEITANASIADSSKTIIIYTGSQTTSDNPASGYKVLKIDGSKVSMEKRKSVNDLIPLNTSKVTGSVFGGGSYSKVYGSTMVNINSGIVGMNVFGGGLGIMDVISVVGDRAVYVENNSLISGSVYGGSEIGVDGEVITDDDFKSEDPVKIQEVKSKLNKSRAIVIVQGGFIKGSVFGGGLMGKTFGNTNVYVGYNLPNLSVRAPVPNTYSGPPRILISLSSVFAGGNVSTNGDDDETVSKAYTSTLVQGSGFISIYGDSNQHVSVSGSVMGSGNACLTRGETELEIINLFNASPMSAIHRATKVTLDNCNLNITGRNPITEVFGQNKIVSVYNVGTLILKGGASVRFDTPMDDIGGLKSQTSGNVPTTDTSPVNRLVFNKGSTVYIRSADDRNIPVYREVEGFVQMVSTQGNYGAYAMARTDSSGGFSVAGDSSLKEADTSISGDMCCWYMSGISRKIATMNLDVGNDYYESHISVTKFQRDTVMMYTGGVFTKMSNDPNNDAYTFVRPGSESIEDNPSYLSLALGYRPTSSTGVYLYDPTYRQMSIYGGNADLSPVQGTFFKKDGRESDANGIEKNRSLSSVPLDYSAGGRTIGEFDVYLCLSGKPLDGTSYVGYIILTFQEVQAIKYEAIDENTGEIVEATKYLIANTTEVRVDIYIYGSASSSNNDTFFVEIKTSPDEEGARDGEASTLIPQMYQMANLNLDDVIQIGAGSGEMPDVALKDSTPYILRDCGYLAPPGKSFDKWRISSGNNSVYAKPGDSLSISETTATITHQPSGSDSLTISDGKIRITPEWTTSADIVFDPNGSTASVITIPVQCGMEYILPECTFTPPSGMIFAKWSVTNGSNKALTRSPNEAITIEGDVVIKAIWAAEKTVTFNRGDHGTSDMDSVKVPYGERYTLPECTMTAQSGYIFDHWSVSGKEKYPGDTTSIGEDGLAVTAIWTVDTNKRTITFEHNGGSGSAMGPYYVAVGSTFCLPACTFTPPTNETFKEWSVTIDGTSNNYQIGEYITITSNATVSAIWVAKQTISFANGGEHGTGSMSDQVSPYGSEYIIPSPNGIVPVGAYHFHHWMDNTKEYYPGQIVILRNDLRLTAVWEADSDQKSKVAFDSNGGTGYMPILKKSGEYTLPNCGYEAPEGMVFSHWTVKIGSEAVQTKDPGEPITLSNDTVVKAEWYAEQTGQTPNYYTITIKESNSSAATSVYKIKQDAYYVLPDNTFTIQSGKVFEAWVINGSQEESAGYQLQVDADVTLIPKWETASSTKIDFDSGRTAYGKVIVVAESNQDNTTGWSNLGKEVIWNLNTGRLESDDGYIGTLLGNIVGNVSFRVEGLYFTDSQGDSYLPTIDLKFDRGGNEAHTTLSFADIQYYKVTFIDHGLETEIYYPENTLLTRELCDTPSGNNFNGWYLDEKYVNRYEYNMVINDESDGLILYGRYTFVVTLDNMNGTIYTLHVSEDKNGTVLTEKDMPIPTYIGYEFAGWCKDKDLIYDWNYHADRVREDTTLYARWIGEDVRVYFWFKDSSGNLKLFDGTPTGQAADSNGKYNLQAAYMMNADRKLYPMVTYGSTFDVKDPYHDMNIMDYAESIIDFSGSFVRWTVVSPTDQYAHVGIYKDTTVGSKVLKYVTEEMREGTDDLWEYYMLKDGGYPRKDWVGDNRPDTMEIHLLAETTKIAIQVSMGLKDSDEKYASTVSIDDPEEFLVYPNGPDLSHRGKVEGTYYDQYGNLYIYNSEGDFYWNEDKSIRYIMDKTDNCWICVDEKDVTPFDSVLESTAYIPYITFPRDNGQIAYRAIIKDDQFGNTLDENNFYKSIAYAIKDGEEKEYLVELENNGEVKVYYLHDKDHAYEEHGDHVYLKFTDRTSKSDASWDPSLDFYFKDSVGNKYKVTRANQNTFKLQPVANEYYEFVYKLNNAVRSGYTLSGWHNLYVSEENTLNPSPDQLRKVHIWKNDDGTANHAKLYTEDNKGNVIELPLLVGNYVIDPKDADVEGDIIIVPYDSEKPTNITVKKIIGHRNVSEKVVLDGPISETWAPASHIAVVDDHKEYTVTAADADVEGTIVLTNDTSSPPSEYTVIVLDSKGNRTVYGKYSSGTVDLPNPGSNMKWMVKQTEITKSGRSYPYTVTSTDSNILGEILIKSVPSSYTGPDYYTVKTIRNGYAIGDPVTLNSLEPERGFDGWTVDLDKLTGDTFTIEDKYVDDIGEVVLRSDWRNLSSYTVIWKDGNTTKHTDYSAISGSYLQTIHMDDDETKGRFLGWKAKSGFIEDSYVVSYRDTDVNASNTITIYAHWENDSHNTYRIVYVTDIGPNTASVTNKSVGNTITLPKLYDEYYRQIGWTIVTGNVHTLYNSPTYTVSQENADAQKDIIFVAEWAPKYSVTILGNDPIYNLIAGEVATLTYTTDETKWRVMNDTIVKGGQINSPSKVFTMTYEADWTSIPYSVQMVQPVNGNIDVFLDSRDGDGTSTHMTDQQINSMVFHYGDKLRLSYTPPNDKISFVKWIITGQYYISDSSSSSTILIIQGDCSISAEESTGRTIDIMIAFDNKNLDEKDRKYTRVFIHEKGTDNYTEAQYISGMVNMEHYVAKVPYGDNYEVCIRYGESLPGTNGKTELLGSFSTTGPDEYALFGDVNVTINGNSTFIFDVISAGFVTSIDTDDVTIVDYVDTEYGKITRKEGSDPTYDFLFTDGGAETHVIREESKRSSLPTGYTYDIYSGAGHPVRILDSTGKPVASVTKYVGILRSELEILADHNLNINNPDGDTPPVVIKFEHNYNYDTYEGFPWEVNSQNVFAIETNINLSIDADSNLAPQKTFYLNWVRTDSPADIVIHLRGSTLPANYATVNINIMNDQSQYVPLATGIHLDLGTAAGGYFTADMPLDSISGYAAKATAALSAGEECTVTPSNNLHLKVSNSGSSGEQKVVTIYYDRDSAWYTLNDTSFGYTGIEYDDGVYVIGSKAWGTSVTLPTSFIYNDDDEDISFWAINKPNGDVETVELSNEEFVYTFTEADALMTSNFIYSAVSSGNEDYPINVQQYDVTIYKIDRNNKVYDLSGKEVSIKFYTNRTCATPYTTLDARTIYTDTRFVFTPLTSDKYIELTFITYYGEFDINRSQRVSVSTPANGTMLEYSFVLSEVQSVARFIQKHTDNPNDDYKYLYFKSGDTYLNLTDDSTHLTTDMTFIAYWEPSEKNMRVFTHSSDIHGHVTAMKDAVENADIPSDNPYKTVVDTEITLSIQPDSGYTIDVERTRGELGYTLVNTHTYVDLTTAYKPAGVENNVFSSWKLWNTGSPLKENYPVTESCNNAKNGFLVYIANWKNNIEHTEAYTLVFVTKEGAVPNLMYGNEGDVKDLPSGNWGLWSSGTLTSYTIRADDAVDGFIVFVKQGTTLGSQTIVYASDVGSASPATDAHPYYLDRIGSKYNKTDRDTVYRYEGSSWVQYTVVNLAGHEGQFIRQFSNDSVTYKTTRDGVFYMASPIEYDASFTGQSLTGFSGEGHTYTVEGDVVKENGVVVHLKLYKDTRLTDRIIELSELKPTDLTGGHLYGTTELVEVAPVLGFFTTNSDDVEKFYGSEYECFETSPLYYELTHDENVYKDTFGTVWTKDLNGELHVKTVTVWSFNKSTNTESSTVVTYADDSTHTPYPDGPYYFKDSYGNRFVGNYLTDLKVTALYLKVGDAALQTLAVKYIDLNEYVKKLIAPIVYTVTSYDDETGLIASFDDGVHYYTVANGVITDSSTGEEVTMTLYSNVSLTNVVDLTNMTRSGLTDDKLYSASETVYYLKRNGELVIDDEDKTAVNGTLYHDPQMDHEYKGDYKMVSVETKYNTGEDVKENGTTYQQDTFGNTYQDWLGYPKQLPGNRGFVWTFFLKESVELTIYTKEVSYNINFIVNGVKVKATDSYKVSTVSTIDYRGGDSHDFYGTDIPQYTIVAFDGPSSDRDIVWYLDPEYETEYDIHNSSALLNPDEFMVDTTMPSAPTSAGMHFQKWKLWGGTEYDPSQTVVLKSDDETKYWKGGNNNYYYVFDAAWQESTTGTYKVVYASNYGSMNANLIAASSGQEITLKVLSASGKTFNGWKVWNTGNTLTTSYTVPTDPDSTDIKDGYILLVADWGEDITNANNVVYASEYGDVPNMESIRKYQFISTRNLSLYAHTGVYVVYIHDFYDNPDKTLQYELKANELYQITLPLDHYTLDNYTFVGWSSHLNKTDNKREYTYVPGEHVYTSALSDRTDLYPYYLSDGSGIKYYNGETVQLQLGLDPVLAEKQHLTIGDTEILKVRYKDSEIDSFDDPEARTTSGISGTHASNEEYTVYYFAEIKTPLGRSPSDASYGNSSTSYSFPGQAKLRILKVDAYVIAPSAYIREGEGKIIAMSEPVIMFGDNQIDNIKITKDNIQFIGLVPTDVQSKRLYTSEADKTTGMPRTVLENASQLTIKPWIVFTDAELPYKDDDYNLTYIDGSLFVYPKESSKDESEGYV